MPHALIVLPDTSESIERRVAVDVMSQLSRAMTIPEDTVVYLPGETDKVPMDDGTFGGCCKTKIHYDPEARMVVRYTEIADEGFTLTSAVNTHLNLKVWEDPIRDVTVTPVRRYVDFRVDIEYQASGVVHAKRWLDDQRIRLSRGGAEYTFGVKYHYMVPKPLQAIIRGVYDTIQCSEWPIDETWEEYFSGRFWQNNTEIATLINTHQEPAIREHQVDIVGWFDFTAGPDAPVQTSDGAGAYTSTVTFTMRYDRPTHLYCRYPLVAHQNPMHDMFWPKAPYSNYQQIDRKTTAIRGPLDHSVILPRPHGIEYVQYPAVNDWTTNDKPRESFTFYCGLCVLEKSDLRTLLHLTDLGDWEFTEWFLEYFATVGSKAIQRPGGLFNFWLYQNNERMRVALEIDPVTLAVRAPADLDPTLYYHLQISVDVNWWAVPDSTFQCLRRYPTVFWNLCRLFNVSVGRKPISEMKLLGATAKERYASPECPGEGTTDWTKDVDTYKSGVIFQNDVTTARKEMDKYVGRYMNGKFYGPFNILNSGIIATRRTDDGNYQES
jgi:hypothetical protein